jgi:hypothetical protein
MKPGRLAYGARWARQQGNVEKAEALEAELAKAGRCKRCGRLLTDPHSIERGVGPECVKKPGATTLD